MAISLNQQRQTFRFLSHKHLLNNNNINAPFKKKVDRK